MRRQGAARRRRPLARQRGTRPARAPREAGPAAGLPGIPTCGDGEHIQEDRMDSETLSRAQFALTTSFHYIYPPISMGLGLLLVVIGIIYVRTRNPLWRELSVFWVRVYGLVFAVGIATGVVQEFEFGTNWAAYSRFVGNIFGSLLAAEGVFAFFLEGGFLGLM